MKQRLVLIAVLALLLLMGSRAALAAGGYNLSWWVVPGGGGVSTSVSPGYILTGAAGQPAAGNLSGSGYALSSGFWVGSASTPSKNNLVYLPLVKR